MRRLKVAILVEHVAPWLGANFNAAARVMNCVAVESRPHATRTMHEKATNGDLFACVPLRTTGVSGATSSLADIRPDVVVTLGWSGARNAAGLSWCLANKVPAVVATDSAQDNFRRTYWRELIKRRIVGLYSAGWAANQAASDYLMALGMQKERVLVGPVDSIDVEHFRSGAKVVRQREEEVRQRRALPHDYFVAVSRFVPEKNIPTLLVAYAQYKKLVHDESWKLVLVGAGPVETKIRKLIQKLGIDGDVLLPGHVQFEELPIYYGLARSHGNGPPRDCVTPVRRRKRTRERRRQRFCLRCL